jgi:N-acetylglucosaminyldiphosphoundecaprenol N-acetyl-beta-D-mannosaminyltransferase
LGLEWLYRLSRQPWRWRRMIALPRFVIRVMREGSQSSSPSGGG